MFASGSFNAPIGHGHWTSPRTAASARAAAASHAQAVRHTTGRQSAVASDLVASAKVLDPRIARSPPPPLHRGVPGSPGSPEGTQVDIMTLLKHQEHMLRAEFTHVSRELVHDLELRLTVQIEEAKLTYAQALQTPMQSLRTEYEETKATTEKQIKDYEARLQETLKDWKEDQQSIQDGNESACSVETGIVGEKLSDDMLNRVSDHVIKRVNADPRICQLVESHQGLQDSFTKLLHLMEDAPGKQEKKQGKKQQHKDVELYDMLLDVQKCCKSIALEVRQLRQRRNQDVSDTTLRFEALEKKQKFTEDGINVDDNNGKGGEVFEAKVIAGDRNNIQHMEDDAFDEETDVQTEM
jgi:hypothetical protein